MLRISIDAKRYWNEKEQLFVTIPKHDLELEHSLSAISKWESKWHKSFFSTPDKTKDEILHYITCMSKKEIDPVVILGLRDTDIEKINDYINDSMTATTFGGSKNPGAKRIITTELIYYWMISLNIPFECEHWHINRLITLINVCSEESKQHKPMSKKDLIARNRALNAQRRAALKTKG